MPSWWSSIEILSRADNILRLLIIIVPALLGLLLWLSSHQLSKLRDDKEIREQIRLSTTEQNTLALRDELRKAKGQLGVSEKTIEEAKKTIGILEIKAKKAERGISSVYDFQGVKRDTTPGVISATVGEETQVFNRLVFLEKERKYTELSSLCEKQIAKTPEWLTPYLFLGIAQANLGLKTNAISNFEHVLKNAPGDPAYEQANEFLIRLRK